MKAIRCDDKEPHLLESGEWKPDGQGAIWLCSPNGHLGRTNTRWVHEWHEDGSVTVSPSIRISGGSEGKTLWHGYLTAGEWKDCGDY